MTHSTPQAATGLLIVGHGTRDESGLSQFRQAVSLAAEQYPTVAVAGAYLELAEPTIAQAIDRLAGQGVHRIAVSPLLLFAAGHAQHDIPAALDAARRTHPNMEIVQHNVLGCHRYVLELSALRYRETIRELPAIPRVETALLMVGRGSHDAQTTLEMHRFARLRRELTPVGHWATCFLAMAQPSLPQALELLAESSFRRVIVQPHLLFQGQLLDDLHRAVERTAEQSPEQQWLLTPPLGVHPLLIDALLSADLAPNLHPDENRVTRFHNDLARAAPSG